VERVEIPQWMLWVTVSHGPRFGHAVTISVVSKDREPFEVARWSWQGIGVPPAMPGDLSARVTSVLSEHLVTRYGVAHTLF